MPVLGEGFSTDLDNVGNIETLRLSRQWNKEPCVQRSLLKSQKMSLASWTSVMGESLGMGTIILTKERNEYADYQGNANKVQT
jgi:hypothetical protein